MLFTSSMFATNHTYLGTLASKLQQVQIQLILIVSIVYLAGMKKPITIPHVISVHQTILHVPEFILDAVQVAKSITN